MTASVLARDMLEQKDIAALPQADDPALLLDNRTKREAHERAYAKMELMYWGPRIPLDQACEAIRTWLAELKRDEESHGSPPTECRCQIEEELPERDDLHFNEHSGSRPTPPNADLLTWGSVLVNDPSWHSNTARRTQCSSPLCHAT